MITFMVHFLTEQYAIKDNANMLILLVCLVSLTSGAPSSGPGSNSTRDVPRPANIPPLITQCFHEGRWFPAGTIINAGRSGNWCYGSFCDVDGHVKHWDDYDCPPDNNANPPFPNLEKLNQTPPTTTTTTPRPVTTAPPSFWFPPTTASSLFNFFNFNSMGCFYRGQFYWAGQDIENRRRGPHCFGTYCDFNAKVQHWQDDCRFTMLPPMQAPVTTRSANSGET